jgi:2-octaprenylphenol hydroxylase
MVGAALAQLLSRANIRVALLERSCLIGELDPADDQLRVSAINPGSERILTAAGAWDTIEKHGVSRYLRMVVWDARGSGSIVFDSADLGATHLGTIVANGLVVFALHRELRNSGVRILADSELTGVDRDQTGVTLTLSGNETVRAGVLIGADGSDSWVRKELGIERRSRNFNQLGIVARVRTELDHQQTAWQRFLATGPLAFLPLSNGDCSIVWSCEKNLAHQLMALDDADFSDKLASAFEYRLGGIEIVGSRKAFALASSLSCRYIGDRTALLGDAAHVVHPLAGQGVNLGLVDAAAMAEVLVEARAANKDIGGESTLRRYERWRKGDNMAMYHAFNGIEKLFGSDLKLVSRLRGFGLTMTDAIGPLKSAFAARAMGQCGDLPKIMTDKGLDFFGM